RGRSGHRGSSGDVLNALRLCRRAADTFLNDRPTSLNGTRPRVGSRTRSMIRLERHTHGPRVHVLGCRVHEWQLGLAIVVGLGVTWLAHLWGDSLPGGLALAGGAWLVVKDWRDVLPSQRDSCAWRLGVHRPALPLREMRRAEGMPALAAAVAVLIGL